MNAENFDIETRNEGSTRNHASERRQNVQEQTWGKNLTRIRVRCQNCGDFNVTAGRSSRCPQCGEFVTILEHISGPEVCQHGILPEWCEKCRADLSVSNGKEHAPDCSKVSDDIWQERVCDCERSGS